MKKKKTKELVNYLTDNTNLGIFMKVQIKVEGFPNICSEPGWWGEVEAETQPFGEKLAI